MLCKIPRPWVQDPNFTIVESAREAATGYSFPSGHTQTSVGVFGGLARWNKNTLIRVLAICACVLVPLSRMYLGVHTPLDVGVSIIVALFLVFVAYPLFKKAKESPRTMFIILGTLTLVTFAYLLFATLFPFSADTDPHNLESAQKNGYTLFGCMLGLIVVYAVDNKYVHFPTVAIWWVQIIKVVGGLGAVLATKELLKIPLDIITPAAENSWARLIRYFMVAVVGGVLWPMTFKFFNKLSKK
jgi:hypothetical protein